MMNGVDTAKSNLTELKHRLALWVAARAVVRSLQSAGDAAGAGGAALDTSASRCQVSTHNVTSSGARCNVARLAVVRSASHKAAWVKAKTKNRNASPAAVIAASGASGGSMSRRAPSA